MRLLRKEVLDMAMVYATLVVRGVKTFKEVPYTLSEQVKQILIDLDAEHLVEEDE